jgi:hypothetical protein
MRVRAVLVVPTCCLGLTNVPVLCQDYPPNVPGAEAGSDFITGSHLEHVAQDIMARGRDKGQEIVVVVDRQGRVVVEAWGNATRVDSRDVNASVAEQGANLTLLHNHPRSLPPAPDDVMMLARSGLAAIGALGHDGSMFLVARGDAFDPDTLHDCVYAALSAATGKLMGVEDSVVALALVQHAMMLALHESGIVEYRFLLKDFLVSAIARHHKPLAKAVSAAVNRAASARANSGRNRSRAARQRR